MKQFFKKMSIRSQINVIFLSVALILTGLLTIILYNQTTSLFMEETTDRAYKVAEQAIKLIDFNDFINIKTIDDESTQAYIKMREELIKVREISGAEYVYTMRKTDDGDFMYVVDGSSDEDFSHVGETEETAPEYEQAWSGEAYTDNNIFKDDKWGHILSIYYPIKDNTENVVGILGIDYDVELISDGLNKFKSTCIIIMVIFAAIILISGWLLADNISKPIMRAVKYSMQLAAFNLGTEVSEQDKNQQNEIGDLAQSLHKIKESFHSIISKISESSKQLSDTSQKMAVSSHRSTHALDDISRTVEEIAKEASVQAKSTESGVSKAALLGNIIDKEVEQANNISEIVENVTAVVHNGLEEIEKLTRINEQSNLANKTISDIIIKTNDSAQKINQASNIITSIAEQTKLLDLNAAIEAARAGEAGRGFVVVADGIGKLAEQSSRSLKTIDQTVKELQINSQEAVNAMMKTTEMVKEQTERVVRCDEKYRLIDDEMKECRQAILELNMIGQEMD